MYTNAAWTNYTGLPICIYIYVEFTSKNFQGASLGYCCNSRYLVDMERKQDTLAMVFDPIKGIVQAAGLLKS